MGSTGSKNDEGVFAFLAVMTGAVMLYKYATNPDNQFVNNNLLDTNIIDNKPEEIICTFKYFPKLSPDNLREISKYLPESTIKALICTSSTLSKNLSLTEWYDDKITDTPDLNSYLKFATNLKKYNLLQSIKKHKRFCESFKYHEIISFLIDTRSYHSIHIFMRDDIYKIYDTISPDVMNELLGIFVKDEPYNQCPKKFGSLLLKLKSLNMNININKLLIEATDSKHKDIVKMLINNIHHFNESIDYDRVLPALSRNKHYKESALLVGQYSKSLKDFIELCIKKNEHRIINSLIWRKNLTLTDFKPIFEKIYYEKFEPGEYLHNDRRHFLRPFLNVMEEYLDIKTLNNIVLEYSVDANVNQRAILEDFFK